MTRVAHAGRDAVKTVVSARQKFDRAVTPVAITLGWLGIVGLGFGAVLAVLPRSAWPDAVSQARLPVVIVVSLCLASLLGWCLLKEGQARVARRIGRVPSLWLLLIVPLACGAISLLHPALVDLHPVVPAGHPAWAFVRWYPPALVVLFLLVFVLSRARPGRRIHAREGARALLLVAPFGLLLAVLVFHVSLPWVDGPMRQSIATMGSGAIVLQLALGYFVGSAPSS